MTSSNLVVRPAKERDASAISVLLHQLGYSGSPSYVLGRLDEMKSIGSEYAFIAEFDSTIVGVITFRCSRSFHEDSVLGRITCLVVDNQHQRQGIGEKLVHAIEEIAHSKGCKRIEVTSGDHREGAHRFYRKMGYEPTSQRFLKTIVESN